MNQSIPVSGHENNPDTLIVDVPANLCSKNDLLEFLGQALGFPDYFGSNWDALEECLKDLTWVAAKRIFLRHEPGFVQLPENDMKIYAEILLRTVSYWKSNKEHEFFFVFRD